MRWKMVPHFVCRQLMNQVSRFCNYSAFELLLPLHWVFGALKNCVFGAGCGIEVEENDVDMKREKKKC
jgi:hypothetical protein